jgi:hypothetical protein
LLSLVSTLDHLRILRSMGHHLQQPQRMSDDTNSGDLELPPGFWFHPTDEEIITFYLRPKVLNASFSAQAIGETNINTSEPWELPSKHSYTFMHRLFESCFFKLLTKKAQIHGVCIAKMGEKEWYFYCWRVVSTHHVLGQIMPQRLAIGRPPVRIQRSIKRHQGGQCLSTWGRHLFSTRERLPRMPRLTGSCMSLGFMAVVGPHVQLSTLAPPPPQP